MTRILTWKVACPIRIIRASERCKNCRGRVCRSCCTESTYASRNYFNVRWVASVKGESSDRRVTTPSDAEVTARTAWVILEQLLEQLLCQGLCRYYYYYYNFALLLTLSYMC